MKELSNYPKMLCPFIRKTYKINRDDWIKYGKELQLRSPEVYLVTPEVTPGYEWVIDDPNTFAVEKLDGTNVKLLTENGKLVSLYNRTNQIDPLNLFQAKGKLAIIEGVFRAISKSYIQRDGEQAGEVVGNKIQQNIYGLNYNIWYPFEKAIKHLRYKSFHQHDRTFENWSLWFKDYLFSLFSGKMGNKVMAEGIVFYNLKRMFEGRVYRAKLRRDMWVWAYNNKMEIYNYPY